MTIQKMSDGSLRVKAKAKDAKVVAMGTFVEIVKQKYSWEIEKDPSGKELYRGFVTTKGGVTEITTKPFKTPEEAKEELKKIVMREYKAKI